MVRFGDGKQRSCIGPVCCQGCIRLGVGERQGLLVVAFEPVEIALQFGQFRSDHGLGVASDDLRLGACRLGLRQSGSDIAVLTIALVPRHWKADVEGGHIGKGRAALAVHQLDRDIRRLGFRCCPDLRLCQGNVALSGCHFRHRVELVLCQLLDALGDVKTGAGRERAVRGRSDPTIEIQCGGCNSGLVFILAVTQSLDFQFRGEYVGARATSAAIRGRRRFACQFQGMTVMAEQNAGLFGIPPV